MMSADTKALEAPAKPKRVPPRRRRKARADQGTDAPKRRANPGPSLWAKAQAAAGSAQLLMSTGDWDGAINRTYYAVFSGARAALAGVRGSLAESKGHSTIVRRLEKHLVQERGLEPTYGRSLFGRLSHARWVADYGDVRSDEAVAQAMLADAERFLAAIEPFLKKAKP